MNSFHRYLLALLLTCGTSAVAQYASMNYTLSLSGTGYLSVPNNSAYNALLASSGAMSIDAWVYPQSFSTVMAIVGNDYQVGWFFGLTTTGRLMYYPRPGVFYTGSAALPLNQWSHVAVSYNARSNALAFYINGAVDRTITTSQGGISSSSGDLRIGADRYGKIDDYFWFGRLDEVRVWNEDINFATAVGLLYRTPHAMKYGRLGKYLAGCWRLNFSGFEETQTGAASPVGTVAYSGVAPLPPHYDRVCAVLPNGQSPTGGSYIDYFALGGAGAFQFTSNYTIECWIKPAATGGGATYQTIIYKGSDYSMQRTWGLMLNKSNGKLRFLPTGDPANVLESTGSISTGVWTHVAARFQTVAKSLYTATVFINGVVSGSKNYTATGTANQMDVLIGRNDPSSMPSTPLGFAGSIDELRIWHDARSDDEIADNFRAELNGAVAGIEGIYHFDGDAYDRSGNFHDGSRFLPSASDAYFLNASDLPPLPSITLNAPNGGEVWYVGTTRAITWNAVGLLNVKIELTRDGGQTYTTLAPKVAASTGSWNWTVTTPTTGQARVRVTTVTSTGIEDVSLTDFSIAEPQPTLAVNPKALLFSAFQNGAPPPPQKIYMQNVGGQTMSWQAAAGSGIWCSVTPMAGASNNDSVLVSITSTALPVGSHTDAITFTGTMTNSGFSVPITLRISIVPQYTIEGVVTVGGVPLPNLSMRLTGDGDLTTLTGLDGRYTFAGLVSGNYTVTPSSLAYEFTPPSRSYAPLSTTMTNADFAGRLRQSTVRIHLKAGWNLISLPVVPTENTPAALFPQHVPPVFRYSADSGYVIATSMEPGPGYWVNSSRTDSVDIEGTLVAALTTPVTSAHGGWNLVGMTAGNCAVSSVIAIPTGIVRSVYAYDQVVGYTKLDPTDMLRAGNAYFVQILATGTLTFNASSLRGSPPPLDMAIPTITWPRLPK